MPSALSRGFSCEWDWILSGHDKFMKSHREVGKYTIILPVPEVTPSLRVNPLCTHESKFSLYYI